MGAYSLPALDIKTPQQPDLLQKYGQLQQIRALQQNQQIQAQEAPLRQQALQQGVDQQQIALQNQQAQTAAYHQWDGKSYEDLAHLALKNGATGDVVQGILQHGLDVRAKYSTIAKDDAETGKNQIETLKQKNDQVSGALKAVLQVPDDQLPQALTTTAQQLAQQNLIDPQHVQAAQQIAQAGNPAQIRQQLEIMRKGMMSDTQQLDEAQKTATAAKDNADAAATRGKIDPNSPFYAPTAASVAMGTAPGAAQIQQGEAKLAGAKAASEAAARQPYELSLAAQRQALSQGDPKAAAQLLVGGDATLSELKARGATPEFIAKTLFAAKQMSGGQYNAQAADAQYSVAKSPANVAFFGSAKSLTDPGGTLDQLAAAAKDIPDGKIPVFNSIADAAKAATGDGPIAKYASLLLGVSDDYSKVMGGGNGSDSSRAQALQLIPAKASPEARAAAIAGVRGAVGSQLNSRIGNNSVLKRMYGDAGGGASGGGMVTVQIPGSPPGQIPAAALAKFKADHPNAQVTQ